MAQIKTELQYKAACDRIIAMIKKVKNNLAVTEKVCTFAARLETLSVEQMTL